MVLQRADNIRPYALGVKYKILRDDVGIVPYVIYVINYSLNPNLSNGLYNTSKYKSQAAFCGLALTVLLTPEKVRVSL